ncbi:MAG: hypothetical protein IJZ09_02695 [Tidjanibacter sp.]|nr:hypothetical protein [Tidjanibacter sp.]
MSHKDKHICGAKCKSSQSFFVILILSAKYRGAPQKAISKTNNPQKTIRKKN